MTTNEFLNKVNKKHSQHNYSYELIEKPKAKDKLKIICNEIDEDTNEKHGIFELRCDMLIFGKGCPKCSTQKISTNEFINRSNIVHGINRYDYSNTKYNMSNKNVEIICHKLDSEGNEHGPFLQIARNHLQGAGCPKCSGNNKLTTEKFILKAEKIHNKKYDYSKTIYKNIKENIEIICSEHGKFSQRPDSHLQGAGCPKCSNTYKISNNEFINRSKNIFGNKYMYDENTYLNMGEYAHIYCTEIDSEGNEHGWFKQLADNHLQGKEGCQICNKQNKISKSEEEIYHYIKTIKNNNIEIIRNSRDIISPFELDIYIPEKKLAIEFNGLYWHSDLFKDIKYHNNKTNECNKNGIKLIQIFEDEWLDSTKQQIIKSRINNLLVINQHKIYARKCIIKAVGKTTEKNFLIQNHLQGYSASKYCYGLYFNGELVSLMSFCSLRKNLGSINKPDSYELLRFVSKQNINVIGGASKLLKHFIKIVKPLYIKTFADRRFTNGENNLYEKIGFKFKHISLPNYFYIKDNKRYNRFNFRKDILISKYGCKPEDTERNFCKSQGWNRIYDSGNYVYEMNLYK